MKQLIVVAVALLAVGGLYFLYHMKSNPSGGNTIDKIYADDLKQRMEQSDDLMVINVLGEDTYADCHIKGSQNIPVSRLAQESEGWDRGKEIVVYCANVTCTASHKAYEILKGKGFTNVKAYEDGMADWYKKGYATVGACKARYLN